MLDEKLSALIDDELDAAEVDECLNRLIQESSAQQAWSRQHLVRAVLKEQAGRPMPDFASQVMAAVDQEPALAEITQSRDNVVAFPPRRSKRTQWAAGFALAASVAAVAMFVPLAFNDADPLTSPRLAATQAQTTAVAQRQRTLANEEARREMQQYLLDHEALVSGHGLGGQIGRAHV